MGLRHRASGLRRRGPSAAAIAAAALLLTAALAQGETLAGPECRVVFGPKAARKQAEWLLREFPRSRRDAGAWLGVAPAGRPTLHLVEDYAGMRKRGGPAVPAWAVAIARRDDLLVFRRDLIEKSPATALRLVLAHEIVHQLLSHLGGPRLPRWFEEGLCVYYAGVPFLEADLSVERLAAAGNLPTLAEADRGFQGNASAAASAYRVGHSAVACFLDRHKRSGLTGLLRAVAAGRPFRAAFLEATGEELEDFEVRWREKITPRLPFVLFVLLENMELTLLVAGALIVAGGYLRWRLRRESAMRSLSRTPDREWTP